MKEVSATACTKRFRVETAVCPPREPCRLMELLIEQIDYDGVAGTLDITFLVGLNSLGQEANFARHVSETVS